MLVSFVLRLRRDQLALGRLVGEIEEVESGRTHAVHDADELVALCSAAEWLDAPHASAADEVRRARHRAQWRRGTVR